MSKKRIDLLWLWISILSFFLMSVTVLFMPSDKVIQGINRDTLLIIIGGCFWGFLILGIISQIILSVRRKAWYKAQHYNVKFSSIKRAGILNIGLNKEAIVTDVIAAASLIGLIISAILTKASGDICYNFLAIFVFSFCMRCIFNGKIYYHITHHYENKTADDSKQAKDNKKAEGEQKK